VCAYRREGTLHMLFYSHISAHLQFKKCIGEGGETRWALGLAEKWQHTNGCEPSASQVRHASSARGDNTKLTQPQWEHLATLVVDDSSVAVIKYVLVTALALCNVQYSLYIRSLNEYPHTHRRFLHRNLPPESPIDAHMVGNFRQRVKKGVKSGNLTPLEHKGYVERGNSLWVIKAYL
jgi:hypothetical protein